MTLELRDPRSGLGSSRWISPGTPMVAEWDADTAIKFGYQANTYVFRCVQTIAQALAGLAFRVGADPEKPQDFDTKAPLAQLLGPPPGGPNPETSARRLWAWTVAQYLVTGRWAWEIENSGTTPVALWPIPSGIVKPLPATTGVNYFAGYEVHTAQARRRFTSDEMFYEWRPSANDWREPESVLQAARLDVSVAVMSDRYDFAFLKNDARPAVIVSTREFEDRDSYDAFKQQWSSEYGGPEKAGRVAIVEHDGTGNDLEVETLGSSHRDMQAIQRYDAKLRAICVAFGVPLSMLGDSSARTFSNAGQEAQNFWAGTMLPLLSELADAVNMRLAPRLGSNVGWFDLSKVEALRQRPDPVTASVGAPTMVQAQLMTINEGRADYGLPSVPDGDRFMTPDEIAALSPAQSQTQSVRHVHLEGRAALAATAGDPKDRAAKRARIAVSRDAQATGLERSWQRALRRLFARQGRSTIARLEGKRGRAFIRSGEVRAVSDEVFDPEHWRSETEDVVQGLYEAASVMGASRITDDFGIAFDLEAPYIREFIQSRTKQLAGYVTDTTYSAIQQTLAEGVGLGEGVPDLAKRIRSVFDEATGMRAELIARTEVVSAANGSAWTIAHHYGQDVVSGQEWIAASDSRTRDSHTAMDGEIVPVGQSFSNGLAYPGDPAGSADETARCRCTIGFVASEAA